MGLELILGEKLEIWLMVGAVLLIVGFSGAKDGGCREVTGKEFANATVFEDRFPRFMRGEVKTIMRRSRI